MLKHGQLVPGIERDDGLQHRRQVFGLPQHAAPFLQSGILVPVEIIDQCVSIRRATPAGPSCVLDRGHRSGEHRINGGIIDAGKIFATVRVVPSPSRYTATARRVTPAASVSPLSTDVISEVFAASGCPPPKVPSRGVGQRSAGGCAARRGRL